MNTMIANDVPKLEIFTERHLSKIPQLHNLPENVRLGIKIAAQIFPFRVNRYVIDELIDWVEWENCPIFRLTFPQKEMLSEEDFNTLSVYLRKNEKPLLQSHINRIRSNLNPHPAGQMELNVPFFHGEKFQGIQHKYDQTVLFFPSQGQTCHSYCTFCFRWAQFIGDKTLKFSSKEIQQLVLYLKEHKEVTDILFTGGDPLIMKARNLEFYMDAILTAELNHIRAIRIGTKALSFWPYRFITDDDADKLIEIFEHIVRSGKHLTIMAHYNHWKELETDIAKEAIRRVRATGAEIRSQGPLLKGINNDARVWSRLWEQQVQLGIIPYYMFVERDTGARHYFEVPLYQAWEIYQESQKQISGICRTARGPSMSSEYGKVEIQGITKIGDEKVFVLRFLQARNSNWVHQIFFAKYDEEATWLSDLRPAFGECKFFFEL